MTKPIDWALFEAHLRTIESRPFWKDDGGMYTTRRYLNDALAGRDGFERMPNTIAIRFAVYLTKLHTGLARVDDMWTCRRCTCFVPANPSGMLTLFSMKCVP